MAVIMPVSFTVATFVFELYYSGLLPEDTVTFG